MRAKLSVMTPILLAAVAALVGCRIFAPGGGEGQAERSESWRLAELADRTRARVVGNELGPLFGPGAEGGPGDFLIENEFVRFIVSAGDHAWPRAQSKGNVLDCAVQGGEDRLRLLALHLGNSDEDAVAYTRVGIVSPGGVEVAAEVSAEGFYRKNPSVRVRTNYALWPGRREMRITTTIRNESVAALRDVVVGDRLYHGRTVRFVDGLGLHPYGRSGQGNWLSFYAGGGVWGLFCDRPSGFRSEHEAGLSRIVYGVATIPPGRTFTCERFLMADRGGPSRVCETYLSKSLEQTAGISFSVTETRTGRPVEGARIQMDREGGGPATLLITDAGGRASTEAIRGVYGVSHRAAGRAPVAPLAIALNRGREHRLALELSRPAELAVQVFESTEAGLRPLRARVAAYSVLDSQPALDGPPFSLDGEDGVALTDGSGRAVLLLPPRSERAPARYKLVASRGPLYSCHFATVQVRAGERQELRMTLRRLIETDPYAAIDFCPHSDSSPDCALSFKDRLLTARCEGLDGAVLSDCGRAAGRWEPAIGNSPVLLAGLEVHSGELGRFSVFPLSDADFGRASAALAYAMSLQAPHRLPAGLRGVLPGAIVQLDVPPQEASGAERVRSDYRGEDSDVWFDALQVLRGRDVQRARKLLLRWFQLLNDGKRVIATGGSDSHSVLWEEAGVARTYIHCPTRTEYPTARELEAALRRLRQSPDAVVSNGPFIRATLNGNPVGSTQSATGGSARLKLQVHASIWVGVDRVKVYRNGVVVESFVPERSGETLVCDRELDLKTDADCWFVVLAEGDSTMAPLYPGREQSAVLPFAFTNPFWVDADGDGAVNVAR